MIPIQISLLPPSVSPDSQSPIDLSGQIAVMIDILRASTTIVHALTHGASSVQPCLTVEQARSLAESSPSHAYLLGGERHCKKIEGFDLDNSPFSYEPDVVKKREILFTTTNGTFALESCRSATTVLIGAFVNMSAIVQALKKSMLPVHLVCAGTNRQLTAEDILFAGAVCDRLLAEENSAYDIHDVQTQMALDFYRARGKDTKTFKQTMTQSLGGSNLLKLGLLKDVDRASEIDRFQLVPEWDPTTNRITPQN